MSRKECIQVQSVHMHYIGTAHVRNSRRQMRTGGRLDNRGGTPIGAKGSYGWDGAKTKGNTGTLLSLFCGFTW